METLMVGAAVWQDRQGTTVNSDESPRERPPQPLPRHRAAAFPIEPADRSAAESRGGGSGRRGPGAGPGAPSRARGAERGRAQVPSRPRAPRAASAGRLLSFPRAAGRSWSSCPSLASPALGSGLALGRSPGNTCGARASRAGDAEGTARFRPPSLPALQPVPGAGGTMVNVELSGSQRCSACRARCRRSPVRGGFVPRNPGDRGVGEQVQRSETTKCVRSTGAQADDAKSCGGRPPPPWGSVGPYP